MKLPIKYSQPGEQHWVIWLPTYIFRVSQWLLTAAAVNYIGERSHNWLLSALGGLLEATLIFYLLTSTMRYLEFPGWNELTNSMFKKIFWSSILLIISALMVAVLENATTYALHILILNQSCSKS